MVDLLLGLQWGDEGKGKIVDVLTQSYDIIARFQGGPNAGHTLEFEGHKHVLHTIPSGIFHPTATNLIGNGVVIDPIIFKKELEEGALLPLPLGNNGGLRKSLLYLSFEDGDGLGPAARSFIGELRYQTMNLPSAHGMLQPCGEPLC